MTTTRTNFSSDRMVLDCGCSLIDGRCPTHAAMMKDIHAAWHAATSNEALELLYSYSDGYGEPGYVPDQGYDWSGIRDSSIEAIEEMYQAVHA